VLAATPHAAESFVNAILRAAGATGDQASRLAVLLVEATRQGLHGHGLSRLPGLAHRVQAGGISTESWRLTKSDGPVESWDGRAGPGHLHVSDASERAARLCAEYGLGLVGVSNSNHGGALGVYATHLARNGLVCLIATNAPAVMAPPGGHKAVLGTNPFCLAAPVSAGHPLVCDFATSVVSRGQILLAAQANRPIPIGWALDEHGESTDDAIAGLAGSLQPSGGAKGFVLALAIEALTGVLLGPAVGPEIVDFFGGDPSCPQGISHLVLALEPTCLGPKDAFLARMDRLREAVEAAGDPGVCRLPGSRRASAERSQGSHLRLNSETVRVLDQLADEFGVLHLQRVPIAKHDG
jgi:(2R)-3-sulfolactate dehydrogenase (NADP+)